MIEAYQKELKNSLTICSGMAYRGPAVWREELTRLTGRTARVFGNGALFFEGDKDTLLVANVDIPGLTVTNIDDGGFVWVDSEGLDAREWEHTALSLPGGERCVLRAEVRYGEWSREDTEQTSPLFADTGMRDAGEVRALVRPGDTLYVSGCVTELLNGTFHAPYAANAAAVALAFARTDGYPLAFAETEAQLRSVLETVRPARVLFVGTVKAPGAKKAPVGFEPAIGGGVAACGRGTLKSVIRDISFKAGIALFSGGLPALDGTVSAYTEDRTYLQMPVRYGSHAKQTVSARDAMCITAIVQMLTKGEGANV